jgi:zinc-binding in reverse transcriptase
MKKLSLKVRLFLWRASQGGLATGQELHRRLRRIQPICSRCNSESEYLTHLLFFCPSSRAIWFSSELALHVDGLPLCFRQVLLLWAWIMNDKQQVMAANLLWCIWKARNTEVIEGTKIQPMKIIYQAPMMETVASTIRGKRRHQLQPTMVPAGHGIILVDGSWDQQSRVGLAIVVYNVTS